MKLSLIKTTFVAAALVAVTLPQFAAAQDKADKAIEHGQTVNDKLDARATAAQEAGHEQQAAAVAKEGEHRSETLATKSTHTAKRSTHHAGATKKHLAKSDHTVKSSVKK